MNSLLIPSSEATLRLEQAFQLFFQSSLPRYAQLCRTFLPLGGLPRAWLAKGESSSGMASTWFKEQGRRVDPSTSCHLIHLFDTTFFFGRY